MKRSKSLLVALVAVLALALSLFTACTTVVPHEHAHSDWEIIVAPTETENGLARKTCDCGDVENVFLPTLVDDSFWTVTETPSTHVENGSIVYSCDYVEIAIELPLVEEHEFGEWTITADPTEDAVGSAKKVCICGEEEVVELPVLGDSTWAITEDVAPDHFNVGYKVYSSIYGDVTIEVAVVPHVYGDWTITVDPTETAEGSAERVCDCNDVDVAVVPALSDSIWTITEDVAPDHFNAGHKVYSSIYGDVTVEVAVVPHAYGDWTITVDPTETAEGLAERVCACEDKDVAVVPALTDSIWTVVDETPSSHLVAGSRTYSSIYGEVTIVLPLSADHAYGDWTITVEPTETVEGLAERVCACEDKDVVVLPVLTDASVWTVVSENLADYNVAGDRAYTSVYGEVTIVLEKLVAPYDSKYYSNVYYDGELDDYYYKNGVVRGDDTWATTGNVAIDANGNGEGTAYPFRGTIDMVMVDAKDGKMTMTVTAPPDSQGEISVSVYNGYVDFATGIILIPRTAGSIYNNLLLLTPFAVGLENTVTVASAWDNAMAIDYVVDGACDVSIFVYNEVVHFGASFVDANGNAISADECYNAPYVYAYDKDGKLIEGFVFNGEKLVVSDKLEGTYTGAMGDVVISGYGVASVSGMDATYEICNGYIGVYVNGEYYEATVEGTVYTAVKPMVSITFDAGDLADVAPVEANKNIAITLPALTHERYTFKGWYLDAGLTTPVSAEFVPTSDVTLYALWAEKVVINLEGVMAGDTDVLYLGEGDVIGEYLPVYGVEESIMKRFIGWYLDANGEVTLPEDAAVSAEDTGITVYAIWADLPVYYGAYKGGNTFGKNSGGYCNSNIAIDGDGNITGKFTGHVVSYDPATQIIVWTENGSANYYMFYDEVSGILTTSYSKGTTLGTDYMVYSRYQTEAIAHYAVQVAKTEGSSSRGYYARVATVATANGNQDVVIYRDRIYSNVIVTDAFGNALTVADIKTAKTLVVKQNGVVVFAVASQGAGFDANTNTTDLDEYFGTYTNDADTLIFDGAGSASLNGVVGTYAVANVGSAYGFDVYLADGAEYYEVTLDGDSFTAVKPMVTITYEEGAYANIEDVTVNKNVVHTLPVLTHAENVFNGWYYDVECTSPVGTAFAPTQDVTVYALWKVKKVFTAVYNNGDENLVETYSLGDVVEIDVPVYAKHEFKGWYTTADFVEGTEWTSGSAIEENITVYAKWVEAEPYYNNYLPTRIEMNNYLQGTSYIYTYNAVVVAFNPDGSGNSTGNPIGNGNFVLNEYVKETGYIKITRGSYTYYGYVDAATGIMILNYTTSAGVGLKKVAFYTPFELGVDIKSRLSSSYWAEGVYRAIQYTFDGTVYSAFVCGENVYFGATFEDANGNAVAGVDCYKAETLIVKDKDGNLIKKFAHDGSMLQPMDGFEGSYTGEKAVAVNGVSKITIDGVEGTYAIVEDAIFTAEAYVDGAYYQVTLNKADYTAVVVKPMVEIAFDTAGLADVATVEANINIAYELPVPTCDTHVFRGWYFDAELTQAVPAEFIPTGAVTVYAKWAQKVVLTIVYGDGAESITQDYASDDVVAPAVISELNGLFFEGWYLDAECTVPFTATSISENTTIYAKWSSAAPFTVGSYGSYAMAYDATTGTWKNTNQGKGSSTSGITITATVIDLVVTFDWKVSSESNWDFMRIYLNGTIAFGSSKSEGSGEKSGSLTFTVPAGASIQIFFEKDSGGNKGDDTLTLSNLSVNGIPVTAMN